MPLLSADEAETAAADLDRLVRLARTGHVPPKPSKLTRTAQRLTQMVADPDGDYAANDRIALGNYGADKLEMTVGDLIDLINRQTGATNEPTSYGVRCRQIEDDGGEAGTLWMELVAVRGKPVIRIVTTEPDDGPTDKAGYKKAAATISPDQAEALAEKLRAYIPVCRRVNGEPEPLTGPAPEPADAFIPAQHIDPARTQTDRPTHPLLIAACDAVARAGEYQPPPTNAQEDVLWYLDSLAELDEAVGDAFVVLSMYYRGEGVDDSVGQWMEQVYNGCAAVAERQRQSARVYEQTQVDLQRSRTRTGFQRRSNIT